jgi:hypothetical protein
MRIIAFTLLSVLISCSTSGYKRSKSPFQSSEKFILSDSSGNFIVSREIKTKSNKLISRVKIFDGNMKQELESTVAVSRVGYVKSSKGKKIAVFPEASQFKIWFNKNEYSSNTKVDLKTRQMSLKLTGEDSEKKVKKSHTLPKGKVYCYFSQIPECVKLQHLLLKGQKEKVSIYILWDSFPYHTELFNGISNEPYVLADFYLSDTNKKELKYSLDLGNQIIFYHFDKQLKFEKMFWISQGISLIRK